MLDKLTMLSIYYIVNDVNSGNKKTAC